MFRYFASTTVRPRLACLVTCGIVLALTAGCVEPKDRIEVTGNGEGGVNVKHVAKDPADYTPSVTSERVDNGATNLRPTAHPAPMDDTAATTAPAATDAMQKRIDELDERVRALAAENRLLKAQTAPAATQP